MLRGDQVGLRARLEADVAVLQAELYDDVAGYARVSSRPWLPVATESLYAVRAATDDAAAFSVVRLADGELAGGASLWGIELHNRSAHIGMALRPAFRGFGLGSDVVAVLCHYAFVVRGLHRLQIETLADNAAMQRAAAASGFVREGELRASAWVTGRFADEVILGLLAEDWHP